MHRFLFILILLVTITGCSRLPGSRVNDGNCILGLQQFEPAFSYLQFIEIEKNGKESFRKVTYDISSSQRTIEAMEEKYCDIGIVDDEIIQTYRMNSNIDQSQYTIGTHCDSGILLILLTNPQLTEDSKKTVSRILSNDLKEKLDDFGIKEMCPL